MGFVRRSPLLALVALMAAPPASAAAAPVALSSGASRTCTGEMSIRIEMPLEQPPANVQTHTEAVRETLAVRMTDGRYEVRYSTTDPQGETLLVAHIRPDGTVTDATMSGGMVANVGSTVSRDHLQRLAMLAARMLPERLVMGRDLRLGDTLYDEAETQEQLATLTGLVGALGLGADFRMEGTGGMPFTGPTGDGAALTLNFAGPFSAQGSGTIAGQAGRFEATGRATAAIDATTGLLRGSSIEGDMGIKLNGVSVATMHMRQNLTCTISTSA